MLVLSRCRDQDIHIYVGKRTVTVRVVDIRGDKVRLGFDADRDVQIHRPERFDKVKAKK